MSRRETPMTRWYWEKVGGTLIEEFMAVPRSTGQARRLLDGLIVLGEKRERVPSGTGIDIAGKDVIVIQAKNMRLGMYLMGQTLFSAELVRRFNPKSVVSVALCAADDALLRPMLESHAGCKVVVCPPGVCQLTVRSSQ